MSTEIKSEVIFQQAFPKLIIGELIEKTEIIELNSLTCVIYALGSI